MISIDAKLLRIASMFSSKDSIRYYLNGVYVEKADEGVILVATDGHRLIVINDKTGNCGEESKIIRLSKNMILETKKSKGEKKERVVKISEDGELSLIHQSDGKKIVTYTDCFIDGTFPKWRSAFKWDIEQPSPSAFNAKYLNDFGRASKELNGSEFISIKGTENGPSIVNFYNCDYAFGVIMPVRFGSMGVPENMKYLETK